MDRGREGRGIDCLAEADKSPKDRDDKQGEDRRKTTGTIGNTRAAPLVIVLLLLLVMIWVWEC